MALLLPGACVWSDVHAKKLRQLRSSPFVRPPHQACPLTMRLSPPDLIACDHRARRHSTRRFELVDDTRRTTVKSTRSLQDHWDFVT
jgi:hypothetical protein